jgi:hypothetical protein
MVLIPVDLVAVALVLVLQALEILQLHPQNKETTVVMAAHRDPFTEVVAAEVPVL